MYGAREVVAPASRALSVTYDGTGGQIARIALRNALFNLLTLGIYRFWAKTRLRRYIWASVTFDGDRLEYTGRPVELLLGFLVAFVVLAVFFGIVLLAALATDEGTAARELVDTLQGIAFLFLIHIAVYRARRYRLTRTQWRGIRGGQGGSAVTYGLHALGWLFVTAITIGLAYPVFRTRLARYRMENTWFGNQRFEFDARAGELFGTWFLAWLFLLPSLGLTYIWYRVREFRYFASRTRFGGLSVQSDLTTGGVIGIVIRYGLVVLMTSLFFGLLVYVLAVALGVTAPMMPLAGEGPDGTVNLPPGWVVFVFLLLYLVAVGVLRIVLLVHPLIHRLAESLRVGGEQDFEALAQSRQDMPKRGEGLADALDVGDI